MDTRYLTIIVLIAVAVVWSAMVAGLAGVFLLALFATALTVGIRTGSLAPYYPAISREEAPAKFWLIMAACAAIIAINIANLLLG